MQDERGHHYTAAPAPLAPPAPAPARHQQTRPVEVIMEELEGWWRELRRAVAGYNHAAGALGTVRGQVAEGARARGLPILTFPATVTGRDQETVAVDLKRIPADQIEYVLIPLVNVFTTTMGEALGEIATRMAELRAALGAP